MFTYNNFESQRTWTFNALVTSSLLKSILIWTLEGLISQVSIDGSMMKYQITQENT